MNKHKMRYFASALSIALLLGSPAFAQIVPSGGGGATVPGGANGQVEYNNAGAFGGFTLGGDCTLVQPNITCTSTGGSAFAASATTDTTNASNITTGSLALAQIATIGNNTILGNATAGAAIPAALAIPSCSTASSALQWTTSTGFGCASIGAGTVTLGANTFTATQTINPAADTTGLIISGGGATTTGTVSPGITVAATNHSTGITDGYVLFGNITCSTACSNSSLLLDLQVGSTSKFYVNAGGGVLDVGGFQDSGGNYVSWASGCFEWIGRGNLCSPAAGKVQLGLADVAGSPVAQTLMVQSASTVANTAGAAFSINGSAGTGTGAGGTIDFYTAPAGSSGSTQNTQVKALSITQNGHLLTGGGVPSTPTGCGTGPSITGTDTAGTVTEGSSAAGCTIPFGKAFSATAHCVLSSQAGLGFTYTETTTNLVIVNVGALSSTAIDYLCLGG